MAPDEFPGVAFHEPVPDWRRYKILVIDVENPGDAPLKLGVRVHDRLHNRMYNDRFNRNFELAPKERRNLRILVEDIRHGPREPAHGHGAYLRHHAVQGPGRRVRTGCVSTP